MVCFGFGITATASDVRLTKLQPDLEPQATGALTKCTLKANEGNHRNLLLERKLDVSPQLAKVVDSAIPCIL